VKVGTDEPVMGHGPAWEDPTSHAVVGESAPSRGGRNLSAALISGLGLGALALILLAIGPAPFAILAAAVLLAAQAELYAVAHGRGYQPATALGLVIGGLILYASYNKGGVAMGAMLTLGLILTFFWYMVVPAKARKGTLVNASITLLGMVYVPFFAGVIFQLLPVKGGRAVVIWIIGLTVIYDVFAFIIGSFWGRRPLAGSISPNKSWEGAIGASLVTFFVGLAFGPQISPLTVGSSIGLAMVVLVMAPLGDLAESALKRDLGVKDMSTIMPGHGGLMDRIDSLLFVLPAAFYFLQMVL
jgi:phosphatidate cytidylyltransferase